MRWIHNPNCDGDHCRSESGQVRRLPLGEGALLLCSACFVAEMRWRKRRNKRAFSASALFDLPSWKELEVYQPEERSC